LGPLHVPLVRGPRSTVDGIDAGRLVIVDYNEPLMLTQEMTIDTHSA
jgi:hypothetical protein